MGSGHGRPTKTESYRFSTDAELVADVTGIWGLYLAVADHVPESAIVLGVDEQSQI